VYTPLQSLEKYGGWQSGTATGNFSISGNSLIVVWVSPQTLRNLRKKVFVRWDNQTGGTKKASESLGAIIFLEKFFLLTITFFCLKFSMVEMSNYSKCFVVASMF
jgi:hypothetical protein